MQAETIKLFKCIQGIPLSQENSGNQSGLKREACENNDAKLHKKVLKRMTGMGISASDKNRKMVHRYEVVEVRLLDTCRIETLLAAK